jgi:hypothetical protein
MCEKMEDKKNETTLIACDECKKIRPIYKFGMCLDCNKDFYNNKNSK